MCKYTYIYVYIEVLKLRLPPTVAAIRFWLFSDSCRWQISLKVQPLSLMKSQLGYSARSHLSLSSGSIIPANCICLAGAYLLPALSCLPLALSAATSFPAAFLVLCLCLFLLLLIDIGLDACNKSARRFTHFLSYHFFSLQVNLRHTYAHSYTIISLRHHLVNALA